jgi:lambda family phage tail tape measure protein
MTDIFQLGFSVDSSQLNQATAEAKRTTQAAQGLGTAVDRLGAGARTSGGQIGGLSSSLAGFANTIRVAQSQIGGLAQAFGIATGSGAGVALNGALQAANVGIAGVARLMGPMGAGVAAGAGAVSALATGYIGVSVALGMAQDKMAMFSARMSNALGSMSAATDAMTKLRGMSQATGIAFDSTADAFLRLARNGEALGATRDELLTLTDTIQKLGAVSGASGGEISSGMLQLSQALASGKLNGDELRSVLENMPALAKAIADGLGVSVGQLRSMGAAGELTGDKVFRSILSQQGKVQDEFKKMPDSIEKEFQRVSDNFTLMLSNMGKAMESSEVIRAMLRVANTVIEATAAATATATPESRMATLEATIAQNNRTYAGSSQKKPAWMKRQEDELAALKAATEKARTDAADAVAKEDAGVLKAPAIRALGTARELDDKSKQIKALTDQIYEMNSALISTNAGGAFKASTAELTTLNAGLTVANQKLLDMADAVTKLKESNKDMRAAIQMGGGGGGIGMVQQAQQLMQQAARDGKAASMGDALDAVTRQKALGSSVDTANLDAKTRGVTALNKVIGESRSVQREAEISSEALDHQWSQFGIRTTPVTTKAVENYTAALRRAKVAQDAASDKTYFKQVADQSKTLGIQIEAVGTGGKAERVSEANRQADLAEVARPGAGAAERRLFELQERLRSKQAQNDLAEQARTLEIQIGAAGTGGYEERRAEANRRAALEERSMPMSGLASRGNFDLQERLNAKQMLLSVERETADLIERTAAKTPQERSAVELAQAIRETQRNLGPADQEDADRKLRRKNSAETDASAEEQTRSLGQQTEFLRQNLKLVGLSSEEYTVQSAILRKQQELQSGSVQYTKEQKDGIMASTRALAEQQVVMDKAHELQGVITSMWDKAGEALTKFITTGKLDFKSFANSIIADIIRVAVQQSIVRPLAKAGGNFLTNLFGLSSGGSFDAGGVRAFANGGSFTNSIVNEPTLFKFANGTGMMGEAGPEAVMPLTRGPGGKLGVQASGGSGNSIVVNIIEAPGQGGTQQRRSEKGVDMLDIFVEKVKASIAGDISRGSGSVPNAMTQTYGLNRVAGAY